MLVLAINPADAQILRLVQATPNLKQMTTAYRMASLWGFDRLQKEIKNDMESIFQLQKSSCWLTIWEHIDAGASSGVAQWLETAYQRLCERRQFISAEETAWLGADRYAAVCRVRERAALELAKSGKTCEICADLSQTLSSHRCVRRAGTTSQMPDTLRFIRDEEALKPKA